MKVKTQKIKKAKVERPKMTTKGVKAGIQKQATKEDRDA